jgi:hypothetical protein
MLLDSCGDENRESPATNHPTPSTPPSIATCKKVIALSTDKAANPINLYGTTKLCSDKVLRCGPMVTTRMMSWKLCQRS